MVSAHPLESDVGLFLIQCLLIIIISRIVTWLFAKIQQPPVIAEIISGILLGPTALGKIPGFSEHLFPNVSIRILSVFAQIGLIFFMFIIGLELDPTLFKSQIKKSAFISFVSIVFPFGLGIAASVYLAEIQGTEWTYSLGIFIGVALCITAFPVLARILTAKKLLSTPIGILSIACAAINDICGWILLGLSVSLAGSANSLDTLWTLLASAGFVAIMILLVRPVLNRVVSRIWIVDPTSTHLPSPSHMVMSATLLLLFISSWCTEYIGIHAMFGSFVLGSITPKIGGFNQAITEKIEDLVLVFLLPLYFVISGLRTDLTTLSDGKSWLGVLLIISCACVGKVFGAGITAKLVGYNVRDSTSIGVLMNTRGLVELIVLNLGLDFGIIHTQVFGIMVLMAVFTTLMTSPLISLLIKDNKKSKPHNSNQLNVVFCTPTFEIGASLVDLGFTMVGGTATQTPSTHLLARKKPKKIYILAVSEVNERPSDFIGQIRKNISKSSYSHLISQGSQMKLKVGVTQICSDNDHLSKEVIQFTENKASGLLIISEPQQGKTISSEVTYQIIKNSISHVGVFSDKSGIRGNMNRFKRILMVYLGGKNENDQETLNLISKMSETDDISITIIVFDNDSYWRHKKSLTITSSLKKLDKSSSNNNNGVLSPEGVPTANESTGLSSTTEIYDPVKLDLLECHLDKVINGKNSRSINVVYKPKKAKIKVLKEHCPNYDLLIVPYEPTKIMQSSPFPSFNVPDLMRKSLSMVHLPGHTKRSHGMETSETLSESSKNLDKLHTIKEEDVNIDDINTLKSSDGIEMNENVASSSSSHSDAEGGNDNYDQRPYWLQCPISTLVVYHRDSIPIRSDLDDGSHPNNDSNSNNNNNNNNHHHHNNNNNNNHHHNNGSNSSNNNNINKNDVHNHPIEMDNLEPYEVDPSQLNISREFFNHNNNNNNNNELHSVVEIPKDKAE